MNIPWFNLLAQALLIVLITYAVYLARKKRLAAHCNVVRVAIGIEIITVAVVMTPSLIRILDRSDAPSFNVLVHHSLGVIVVLLWIYLNLAVANKIKRPARLIGVMRAAYALWLLTFFYGVYIYLQA